MEPTRARCPSFQIWFCHPTVHVLISRHWRRSNASRPLKRDPSHTFSISLNMDMVSTDERVDQWQVRSDTHGHNVVVVFEATRAFARNINTAAIELEDTIDVESLPGINPFSFAEIGFACGWPLKSLYKIIEEYFASYYFKVRFISHVEKHPGIDNSFRFSHSRTMVRILPRVSSSRTSALSIAGKPG